MIGSVFAILFTSEDFSNKYLRITTGVEGIVSMKSKHLNTSLVHKLLVVTIIINIDI